MTSVNSALDKYWEKLQAIIQQDKDPLATITAAINAHVEMTKDVADLLQRSLDMQFGEGFRLGRDKGLQEGWAQRDEQAQTELNEKIGEITALKVSLDIERTRAVGLRGEQIPCPAATHATPTTSLARNLQKHGALLLGDWSDDVTH